MIVYEINAEALDADTCSVTATLLDRETVVPVGMLHIDVSSENFNRLTSLIEKFAREKGFSIDRIGDLRSFEEGLLKD